MTVTVAPLTNEAYGFPRGAVRRMRPRRLHCAHITGNPSTPPATAMQERNHANRKDSGGPSAHVYIDRTEGSDGLANVVEAIDPKYAAWSNGDLRSPKTSVPGVSEVVALARTGFNANEDYYRESESCGRPGPYPITAAQIRRIADYIARDSIATGLPIDRSTVHLHSDLNTVDRPNCPCPNASKEAWASALITAARQRKAELQEPEVEKAVIPFTDWNPRWVTVRKGAPLYAFTDAPGRLFELNSTLSKESEIRAAFDRYGYVACAISAGETPFEGAELLAVRKEDVLAERPYAPPADCSQAVSDERDRVKKAAVTAIAAIT